MDLKLPIIYMVVHDKVFYNCDWACEINHLSTNVTGFDKTRLARTRTEIQFIA